MVLCHHKNSHTIDTWPPVSVDHYHWLEAAVWELFALFWYALCTVAEGQEEFYGQNFHAWEYSGRRLGTLCPSAVLGSQGQQPRNMGEPWPMAPCSTFAHLHFFESHIQGGQSEDMKFLHALVKQKFPAIHLLVTGMQFLPTHLIVSGWE